MNYIAHIFIAQHTQTSKLGNFLGDFIRGSDLSHLPVHIQAGIKLHRAIDTYTDSHPQIKALKTQFPKDLRRMSGVIIDMYFDHLLLSHWPSGTSYQPEELFSQFYQELSNFELPHNAHFTHQKSRLIQHQWLAEYRNEQTCFNAFFAIEKRLNGKILFAERARHFLTEHSEQMQSAFTSFFPELLAFGVNWTKHSHQANTYGKT